MSTRHGEGGLTFVEMIATAAILLILASVILPVGRSMHQRRKEIELRRALREIRTAIDQHKKDADTKPPVLNQLELKAGNEGYPESLEVLVEGVRKTGMSGDKIKYLRRIPMDPMTNSTEWGLRCYQDEPDSTSWCGKNVYDVYTTSGGRGMDDTPYAEW